MNAPSSTSANDISLVSTAQSRRPAWRRRLVELERGVMIGFRASGAVMIHFFCGTIGLVAGLLFEPSALEWAALIVCFTASLAFELGYRSVVFLCRSLPEGPNGSRQAECAAAAAATLIMCGSILASLLILGARAYHLWQA
jgi:hypothetical protein